MLWDQKSCLKNKVAAQLDANINSEKLKIIVAVDIVLFPNKKHSTNCMNDFNDIFHLF